MTSNPPNAAASGTDNSAGNPNGSVGGDAALLSAAPFSLSVTGGSAPSRQNPNRLNGRPDAGIASSGGPCPEVPPSGAGWVWTNDTDGSSGNDGRLAVSAAAERRSSGNGNGGGGNNISGGGQAGFSFGAVAGNSNRPSGEGGGAETTSIFTFPTMAAVANGGGSSNDLVREYKSSPCISDVSAIAATQKGASARP